MSKGTVKLQLRVLYRQFLLRIVDLELLAPKGDVTKLLGQFAALLTIVSLWVMLPSVGIASFPLPPDLGLLVAWVVAHFLISTTMLAVGLFAVLSWESMFPDRRDVLVLAPLPVRGGTLFMAKVAAVGTALGLTVVALNIFPSLAAPFVFAAAPTLPPPTYDPSMAPLSAADLQPVLDRDLIPAMTGTGALAPEKHAGVAIGVLKHGGRRVFAYGTADPTSIFEIGSITKTFTGLVLARMTDQGKVKLDQSVRELLPPGIVAKPQGSEITLLDLATHHSGLPQIPDNQKAYEDYSVENLYAYVSKHGVAKPANADFLYSNLGFGLLGQALANRAGMSYPNTLQEEVTGRLGMSDTVVNLSQEKQARAIQGYDITNRPMRHSDLAGLAAAGALHSTAEDMLTYLDAQLHPEKFDTFSPAIELSHQLRADAGLSGRVALAWAYNPDLGIYWHNGSTSGFCSYAFFDLKGDYAAVVLMNNAPTVFSFADQLGAHIGQRLAGAPAISLANPVVSGNGGAHAIRALVAYWVTMLAAGAFILCAVLTVQGAAQLLPRQWFLRISAVLQMAFFCLILLVYFLQPILWSEESLVRNQSLLLWLPSYWFLGLFQELNGTMPPVLAYLARRAEVGLGVAVGGAALAYLICYFRTLRKIAEQPDILPGRSGIHWLPRFGGALATAVVQFSIRTLLRSRQHRMILSFYLGVAFGLVIFFSNSPALQEQISGSDPWRHVNTPMLVASIVLMGAAVLGARVVFSLPLDLRANWIFRVTPIGGVSDCMMASRRALYVLAIVPAWTILALVFLWLWPWRPALAHLGVLGLLGATLAELCLYNFHKIPFTCSYLPGKSYAHMVFLSFLGMLILIDNGADLERRALESAVGLMAMLGVFGILGALARRRTSEMARSPEGTVHFEEAPIPAILALGIYRDGTA